MSSLQNPDKVSKFLIIPFGFQEAGKALVGEGEGVYTKYMTEPESREQHSQNLKGEGYRLLAKLATLTTGNGNLTNQVPTEERIFSVVWNLTR